MSEQNYANVQQQAELMKYISDNMKIPVLGAGGGFAPIGFYGWSADYVTGAPQGWLRCEGQEVNIADYPELATFYASQHGASNYWGGDGITTFAVPDLRGEFIRGAGTNSHENQGSGGAVGEHQDGTEHHDSILNYATDQDKFWLVSGYNINKPDYTGGNRKQFYSTNRDFTATPSRDAYVEMKGTEASGFTNKFTSRPTNTSGAFFVKATVSGDANGHVYSTDEQIVGTWIDGKPLYEKTIETSLPNVETDKTMIQKEVSTGLDSWGICILYEASIVSSYSNGNSQKMPYIVPDGYYIDAFVRSSSHAIVVRSNMQAFNNRIVYLTIHYTKSS